MCFKRLIMNPKTLLFLLLSCPTFAQQAIGDFISVEPLPQNTDFIIPSSHIFQRLIEAGDPLTQGGVLPNTNDFAGYVPINGSSENGYLGINAEAAPGGVSILDINFNSGNGLWNVSRSQGIDFSSVVGTAANCSGTVTPWNTIISCEEVVFNSDINGDGHYDLGWCVEIDPATKTVLDKRWALGNMKHENVVVHQNRRTLYEGADDNPGYLYKFVADTAEDLSSGKLYVYKGSKNGPGNWVQINNGTPAEQNSTVAQSTSAGATAFNGIEDVEIGPDGWIYFAVKNESRVYRLQDSDPVSGTSVPQVETYVGNASYTIAHENGSSLVDWGSGNDNLAFDGDGNLWVLQDSGNLQNYIWVVENGHTQASPKVKIFGRTPAGSEPTGITFSPDYRFLFMSIQHPNSGNDATSQIDAAGNMVAFNKHITLVIKRKEMANQVWYLDADGDAFAHPVTITSPSSPGAGYTTIVLPTTDCDDNDATINPNTVWYLDNDGDGYADPVTQQSCTNPGTGYATTVLPVTDCDDNDASVHEGFTWYLDADGDQYADPVTVYSCQSPGDGYTTTVLPATDCDDSDASVHQMFTWYLDADGDRYADSTTVDNCLSPGDGYTTEVLPTTDCDDSDNNINPDTLWYLDANADGYADAEPTKGCTSPGEGYSTQELPVKEILLPEGGILYPNPSTNQIFIDLGQEYAEIEMTVLNPLRQVVAKSRFMNAASISFDLADKSTGVYFVQLMANGQKIGFFRVIKL
jgi:hypothetical protein